MAVLKVMNKAGKYHDTDALRDVISYIRSPVKTKKEYIGSWAISSLPDAALEMDALSKNLKKDTKLRLRHFIIGFDPDILPLKAVPLAFEISKTIAKYYGDYYQIVFAVHLDKDYLHTHFIMNSVSYVTGRKYKGKKDDLKRFVRYCNETLRRFGLRDELVMVTRKD